MAVVVAQLVERSLPTPEICSSNPVSGKIDMYCCVKKTKIKKKRSEWPIFHSKCSDSSLCHLVCQGEFYFSDKQMIRSRVPPQLSGFICAFHPDILNSSTKHTIYAFSNLLICAMWKRTKINKKRPGLANF